MNYFLIILNKMALILISYKVLVLLIYSNIEDFTRFPDYFRLLWFLKKRKNFYTLRL